MLKKTMVRAAVLSALGVVGSSAWAQNSYMRLTGGVSSWDIDCAGTSSCETRGASIKLLGGHNFNQNFGIEGAVFSLGRGSVTVGSLKAETKAHGFEVAGIARTSFSNKLGGFLKLGFAASQGTAVITNLATGVSASSTSNSTVEPTMGLGLTYQLGHGLQVRSEWETGKVEVPGGKLNINNFSAGIQYSF